MKNDIVLFTGFVGGNGGAVKAARTYHGLREQGINPLVVSESLYVQKLRQFQVDPDLVIERQATASENYAMVRNALHPFDYHAMISFGPRTFGPRDAVERGKKVVAVDGGLPPFLGDIDSDHAAEVYFGMKAYVLTCHFPWRIPAKVMQQYQGIDVSILPHPADQWTKALFEKLREEDPQQVAEMRERLSLPGKVSISLQIGYSYFDEQNLTIHGGWLKPEEYQQSVKFLADLLASLRDTERDITLLLDRRIATKFNGSLQGGNVDIIHHAFSPIEEDIIISRSVDLNISRAMRSVTQFQIAASGGYAVVCPCPTAYMHEDVAAEDAEREGLIQNIPIASPDLGSLVIGYIGSQHYHDSKRKRTEIWQKMDQERNFIKELVNMLD